MSSQASTLQPSHAPFNDLLPDTPAFVLSTDRILGALSTLREAVSYERTSVLYATKACSLKPILEVLRHSADGFAVASPAEAKLAQTVLNGAGGIHITTPGFRPEWFRELPELTHVAFNSLPQLERCSSSAPASVSLGIRINPGRSAAADARYDPGRKHSKLGVPIRDATPWLKHDAGQQVRGLHVHNACYCRSWMQLRETVSLLITHLRPVLDRMDWINLGGGYLWDENTDFTPLQDAIAMLSTGRELQVFLEPGTGLVEGAGHLVASVIDLFNSDGKTIAILDTAVNHLPEVLEFGYEPDLLEHRRGGAHSYLLAGCSCLAGDLFGEYSFDSPLSVGSRVTFANVGAYSLVKAHRFNGIELPSVYVINSTANRHQQPLTRIDLP